MDRQQAFQRLKAPCIGLLQAVAKNDQSPASRTVLIRALTYLLETLQPITAAPGILDAKLAEYAFVPISQVLRVSRQVPVRALELCLDCTSLLLRASWGGGLEPALSGQLLILFTFLAKPSSAENGITTTSHELQSLALKCMAELLTAISQSAQGRQTLTDTANIPALGEAVLTILTSLTDSNSQIIQIQAVAAVSALIQAVGDDDALASFLPKIISSLTKVLTPTTTYRPNFRVIQRSLEVYSALLSRLLGDQNTKNLPDIKTASLVGGGKIESRSTSWLQATASQIKIALGNVFRQRDHNKHEVRQALLELCLCILRDCRKSLSDCASMAIETLIGLVGEDAAQDSVENQIKSLLVDDQSLSDLLRESLHGWILSFPRIMQSRDDTHRHRIIHQISVTLRLFDESTMIIDDKLADNLRDGVSAIFSDSKGLEEVTDVPLLTTGENSLMLASETASAFPPIKLRLKGQNDMLADFRRMIRELSKSQSAVTVAQELTRSIEFGSPENRLSSFWVAVNLIRDAATLHPSIDDFLDFGTQNPREEVLDDLYSHSLRLLTQQDLTADLPWQYYALAFETVALQASRYKSEFRAELSEVLYPMLHALGSSNPALRQHALTCLNIVSTETGYVNAGELVVANVDYIVNAVGLKLAIGDVSPQAPTVLLMMMRLCGPSLLPYLDDLVGSIFDSLERYHGYPKLAELLFSVLKGVTEEGVKNPQLAITQGEPGSSTKRTEKKTTIRDVVNRIKQMTEQSRKNREADEQLLASGTFPRSPWKDAISAHETKQSEPEQQQDDENEPTEPPPPPPPAPQTYALLLKISELTQHYLTTSSPSLRISLLSLLRTTIPALARHEDSFLPLINTLWPVLLPRLEDAEAYIVASALDTVALLCEFGKAFMKSRVESAWGVLRRVYRRSKQDQISSVGGSKTKAKGRLTTGSKMSSEIRIKAVEDNFDALSLASTNKNTNTGSDTTLTRPELYTSTPSTMLTRSLTTLLCSIAQYTGMSPAHFDETLDMLESELGNADVRAALEVANSHAVWLRLFKMSKDREGRGRGVSADVFEGVVRCTRVVPVAREGWRFVEV